MKQLLDFIPLIIFFALYKFYDIYVATGALIAATTVQVIVTYAMYKKVEKMQLITFVMVALFGGMTLALHDDNFIKWKVTIVYVIFALGLTISQIMGKPAIKGMLGKELTLPDAVWSTINWAWVMFFSGCAALNLYVAYHLPLDVWVNFKVFGLLAATLVFTLLTGGYIYKHLPHEPKQKNQ
ncbi:septation protein A [Vibrio cholerae]|uniref:septation protein A n=1 Tax=Vibrio cholerae TaxID=666 RepID=UPI0020814422|nr:septation protein A [Vibrio cholerae]EGR1860000.1 septation protein A [Vibrio cholerae]ELL7121695.1 septation protein A [Vibrio cholerae]ELU9848364.1 septation protein A [Vibrio cholerae]ELV3246887.1 septation protein A [Vibrio cholerae]MCX9597768.1 septation protein A [Vibrio cholerae]